MTALGGPNVEVRLSTEDGKGKGVFATKDIPEGETVFTEVPLVSRLSRLKDDSGFAALHMVNSGAGPQIGSAGLASRSRRVWGAAAAWGANRCGHICPLRLSPFLLVGRPQVSLQHIENRGSALVCYRCLRFVGRSCAAGRSGPYRSCICHVPPLPARRHFA